MVELSWPQASARRLERHALATPADKGPAEIAAGICGAHAQVISAAELSIGIRLAGATRSTVREALWTERGLIKTRGPRGTVHLLASEDLPMWTGALSAMPSPPHLTGSAALMTPEQTDQVVAAIAEVLADAELTVEEMTEGIVERTGSWAGDRVMDAFQDKWPRWMNAMATASNRGAMCFGPNRGRKITYTNPARWLTGFRPSEAKPALSELVRRYLYAYGPATPAHFARWLAVPAGWASELFDSLAGELEEVQLDGARAWVIAGDTETQADPPRGVRLLPYFDASPSAATRASCSSPARPRNARWPAGRPATSRCS